VRLRRRQRRGGRTAERIAHGSCPEAPPRRAKRDRTDPVVPGDLSARDLVAAQIEAIATALAQDDPALVRRLRRLQLADTAQVIAVVGLLAIGAVTFTVGLAAGTPVVAGLGATIMSIACLVDRRQHHPAGSSCHETPTPPSRRHRDGYRSGER
jgi:hypothetical protein